MTSGIRRCLPLRYRHGCAELCPIPRFPARMFSEISERSVFSLSMIGMFPALPMLIQATITKPKPKPERGVLGKLVRRSVPMC